MKQAQTSVKVATITGAAKDDLFNGIVSEDGGAYTLDVLANDPGAARLYSVEQNAGSLAGTAQFPIVSSASLGSGATVSIVGGALVYEAGGGFQSLGAGVIGYDTFVYTVRMANGALSTATATVAVTGVNDLASISGTASGGVAEDGTGAAAGTLLVSDVDSGESAFQDVAAAALTGGYGDFTFDAGAWAYALRNGDANVQALRDGEEVSDSLVVASVDGTASETIVVTITGTNDAASISGTAAGSVAEDGTAVASGALVVSDVDTGEAVFSVPAALAGVYGDFTFDAGAWTYTLRNGDANVQALATGQQVTDTLEVVSLDGTASQTITVTIDGVNEPSVVPDPEPEGNPVTQYMVNHGLTTINGRYVITGFDNNDVLKHAASQAYQGFAGFDYDGDASLESTLVTFSFQGNPVEVVLVGYTDFSTAQLG